MSEVQESEPEGLSNLKPANPLIALVVSCYKVEKYLPAFLRSLENQSVALDSVQLIFVDDGSPDDSVALIEKWADVHAPHASIIRKDNGGLASARKAGLVHVSAPWVSFPDPDDVLTSNYLADVMKMLDEATSGDLDLDLVSCHLVFLDDATGEISDTHPLESKFQHGRQVVDLDRHPTYIQLSSATAFYRVDRLHRLEAVLDPGIRPNFEDAFFTTLYLNEAANPKIAVLPDARYLYRRRQDNTSLVQSSWSREEKYTVIPKSGYLRLLELVKASRGYVPEWVQNLVLYDLLFYFKAEDRVHSPTVWVRGPIAEEFHKNVEHILEFIEPETIDGFVITNTSRQIKNALLIGYQRVRCRPHALPLIRVDPGREIVQIRYYYGGSDPVEEYRVRGLAIEPVYSKTRDISYFGRVLAKERIVWLPADGTIRVRIDGHPMPLTMGRTPEPVYTERPARIWRSLTKYPGPSAWRPTDKKSKRRVGNSQPQSASSSVLYRARASIGAQARRRIPEDARRGLRMILKSRKDKASPAVEARTLQQRADMPEVISLYRDAWTFIDRDTQAQDNAEHLYRYVMSQRPDINAWFVLNRSSSDWVRLESEGFRLVEHGSDEHTLLLLHTRYLVSSQVDHYIVHPLDRKSFKPRGWRFIFLQHGVTKDDISYWINGKPISLLVTASPHEYASIVGDHTPYIFTEKEVALVGFPRHDRLREIASRVDPQSIVVMPTWRRQLLGAQVGGVGNSRELRADFWDSTYAKAWLTFLQSDRLRDMARSTGLDIVYMPHPNMQAYLKQSILPKHVQLATYTKDDVQEVLASAAVLVTDYSSQAFEAAYIERPVVYFQFDQADFFSGSHAYRRGSWSYAEDGFGPVTTSAVEAVDAVGVAVASHGPQEPYLQRMRRAFAFRDGRCSERVVQAVEALDRPLAHRVAYRRVGAEEPGH